MKLALDIHGDCPCIEEKKEQIEEVKEKDDEGNGDCITALKAEEICSS